jgi:hypothetical protein
VADHGDRRSPRFRPIAWTERATEDGPDAEHAVIVGRDALSGEWLESAPDPDLVDIVPDEHRVREKIGARRDLQKPGIVR